MENRDYGSNEDQPNETREGLSREDIDNLARNPHFLEALINSICRDRATLENFAEALVETDSFKGAIDDVVEGIVR